MEALKSENVLLCTDACLACHFESRAPLLLGFLYCCWGSHLSFRQEMAEAYCGPHKGMLSPHLFSPVLTACFPSTGRFREFSAELLKCQWYVLIWGFFRFSLLAKAAKWSPSPLLMGAWPPCGPVGPSPRSSTIQNCVPRLEIGMMCWQHLRSLFLEAPNRFCANTK